MSAAARLASAADFQSEWYYSLLIVAMIVVTGGGFVLALRPVRAMWRAGEHGLAWVVVGACAVTMALFTAMFLQVVIGLLPGAFGRSG